MAFSSSMLLADLDYIAPSQACIKPMLQQSDGSVYIHGKGDAPPVPIKITLQDCLACSGCVTTAETMLVTSQSREEIESFRAANPDRPIVVSISDASVASLAVAMNTRSITEAYERIAGFVVKYLGASAVIDLRWAHLVSLDETAKEYVWRLQHAKSLLPMIISSCPGWVCYCEKTHPQLLPLLCPVMSPLGIGGSYLKHVYPNAYHVSIQPCFDRKLEAVREDFTIGEARQVTREDGTVEEVVERMTNCVLSTHELWAWMEEVGLDEGLKAQLSTTPMPFYGEGAAAGGGVAKGLNGPLASPSALQSEAATLQGSGSYHQYCIEEALRAFPPQQQEDDNVASAPPPPSSFFSWEGLQYQSKRNANHRVLSSDYLSSTPIKEVCIAYGFQHIQNLVRGINRKMPSVAKHTLIEVMACPEGCLNGGGQVRTQNNQETLAKVNELFQSNEEALMRNPPPSSTASASTGEPPATLGPRTESQVVAGAVSSPSLPKLRLAPLSDAQWAVRDAERGFLAKARVTFRDRKAEMEKADNIVHSLKW